jgi:hypothetical protein
MAVFQFYLQSGKQRKVATGQVRRIVWVGDSHIFGQIPWRNMKCETVRGRDVTACYIFAKVRDEVFAHSLSRRKASQ